jgi:hypothetical protein
MTTATPDSRPASLSPRAPQLPTVVLPAERPSRRRTAARAPRPSHLLRDLACLNDAALRARLRTAGMARFDERVAEAAEAVAVRGVEQALMTGIMDGLGYAENRPGFAELARRVPFAVLQATARSAPSGERAALIADLLLGGSRLADLNRPSRAWVQFIGTPPMDPNAWKTSGVRPSNHPRRRIAALASYVAAADHGLRGALLPHALHGPRQLVHALCVSSSAGPALVGDGRAIDIAINAVLPILVA